MDLIRQCTRTALNLIESRRRWVLAGIVCAVILGAAAAPRALVVLTFFGPGGVNCTNCDEPYFEPATLGAPVRPLIGAEWVASANGTPYAGGLRHNEAARFHLDLKNAITESGTTHFLVTFTTVVTGDRPGRLHVRDTSPGEEEDESEGDSEPGPGGRRHVRMVALPPTPAAESDTGLIERVYRTPGADNFLNVEGVNSSTDRLPWDHRIHTPIIDFTLRMSGLRQGETWGLSTVVFGVHRMPCHCQPGTKQNLANGCVPQNSQDVQFATLPPLFLPPQVYCPTTNLNACGKKQAQAWSCAEVQDTFPARQLPFSCTVTSTNGNRGVYSCSSDAIEAQGIPASSCTYTAKVCQ